LCTPVPTHIGAIATFTKLPSGRWRAQVRRKGQRASRSFRLKSEAEAWAQNAEGNIPCSTRTAMTPWLFIKSTMPSVSAAIVYFPTTPDHSAQLSAVPARRSTSKISISTTSAMRQRAAFLSHASTFRRFRSAATSIFDLTAHAP